MEHVLKIEDRYLKRLRSGEKKAEVRFNDRDYQVNDILVFEDHAITKIFKYQITHIHSGLGMAEGYVCLSLVEE